MPIALERRRFLVSAAAVLGTAATAGFGRIARADGPFTLPPLPYAADANEPHIDARTMEIHRGRHHNAYVNNLNNALANYGGLAQVPLDEVLGKLGEVPDAIGTAVRNNGGGHANHSMFWEIMGGEGGAPESDLAQAIELDLGRLDALQADFNAAGGRVFGSGWVFVTVDGEGRLAITTRPNQDTPLMDGERVLMGNDVWAHAYYLNYQNRRGDYLEAWWNVLDWQRIGERYAAALDGSLRI